MQVQQVNSGHGILRTEMKIVKMTRAELESLVVPDFQRLLKINAKTRKLTRDFSMNGNKMPGIIHIGNLIYEPDIRYILDGQQRRGSFLRTTKDDCIADVREMWFANMSDMGDEYVCLNSNLVRMKPDNILAGKEPGLESLQLIRRECPFVGYVNIRKNSSCPVLSMASGLRAWAISAKELPIEYKISAESVAESITPDDAGQLIAFLKMAWTAWGKDRAYHRLWMSPNLPLSMWMFRRLVISRYNHATVKVDNSLFEKCLMQLSTSEGYIDWLHCRKANRFDVGPGYNLIKGMFAKRLRHELGKKVSLPCPDWSK